ncbi:MAG: glycosyltransferase family 2 protein [Candidatus Tyrphobacter sp.]
MLIPRPLVSIIVTTRNSSRTLEACLRSARAQTHPSIELIVVDNASTDSSVAIARSYADWVLTGGPERCAQRNAGVAVSAGEYVLIIDSDMVLESEVVRSCVERCGDGDAVAIDEVSFGDGFWARCKTLERGFYRGDRVVSAARFFRRRALVAVGGYDESLLGGEDWDVSMRIVGRRQLVFAGAVISHDEGHPRLRDLLLKKLYYSRGLSRFLRKHGLGAVRRLNPVRGSLVRNIGAAAKHPVLGGGLVIMKTVELTGILLGMTLAPWISNETIYGK